MDVDQMKGFKEDFQGSKVEDNKSLMAEIESLPDILKEENWNFRLKGDGRSGP